jgi:(p)ppGpp synthase/HD superfamily hydrolase
MPVPSVLSVKTPHMTFEAMTWAMQRHGTQSRKGIPIPYFAHPMAVAEIVAANYPLDYRLHIAALCHDLLEDTETKEWELREKWGDDVADLVVGVTAESDGLTWREMREKQIAKLEASNHRVQRLKAADMTHNARSMIRDVGINPEVWMKFKATPADIAWYYQSSAVVLAKSVIGTEPLVHKDLVPAVQQLWYLAYEAGGLA